MLSGAVFHGRRQGNLPLPAPACVMILDNPRMLLKVWKPILKYPGQKIVQTVAEVELKKVPPL